MSNFVLQVQEKEEKYQICGSLRPEALQTCSVVENRVGEQARAVLFSQIKVQVEDSTSLKAINRDSWTSVETESYVTSTEVGQPDTGIEKMKIFTVVLIFF